MSIYGREYSIRGDADPGYIREIAHYLDMKMRQMTDNTTVPSTAKVAILAALNITDELFQRERQIRETADDRESAVSVLAARIERTLSELSQPPSFKASPDTLEIEELQQIETSDRA
ncbi:MAG TPA: cell division protein ZapA [Candidatus Fermentibacter daniensis]|nr:MAG: hypothetical protein AO396_05905 [Candidatus Fermentibacter daniensis]KZD18059.1 MAG: hypothetical protein AO395_01320 [Candidatus Fermentibacter daniensis]KZD19263.1 MAG: hypothetical protein AO394_02250 [Candidatus Fermentibacter daniensis]HOA05521.1 cell division protein ZapA [Candidatus Fermentibacter daniensis]HOD19213.1 cell division protein ZapA [Candidatus Fermentibacter daniensis]